MMFLSPVVLFAAAACAFPIDFNSKPYDQQALDQFNVLRFLGTASPYVQQPGHGIDPDVPYGCELEQVVFIARHGERYPTKSKGKSIEKGLKRIRFNITDDLNGPLSFLPSYDFIGLDPERYDDETFKGPYAGLGDMYKFGEAFRNTYDHLVSDDADDLVFYTASQERVVVSARKFAEGFLGKKIDNSSLVIIDEDDENLGANSLTPITSCRNYNETFNDDLIDTLSDDYLKTTAKRLNKETPGLNLTTKEVEALFNYCGFDLTTAGKSAICEIFTTDELLARSYANDVDYYYHKGPGYNLSVPVGSVFVNAVINLFKDETRNLTMTFAHDTDIFFIVSTLGIYDGELPLDHQSFNHLWKVSNINPMGSRLIFEKLQCSNESYVRVKHNDAVIPITSISSGPGYSCTVDEFEKYIEDRLNGVTYAEACGNPDDLPAELNFLLD